MFLPNEIPADTMRAFVQFKDGSACYLDFCILSPASAFRGLPPEVEFVEIVGVRR